MRRRRSGNGRLEDRLNVVYGNLHVVGYYGGTPDTFVIKHGFAQARELIDTLQRLAIR